MPTVAARADVVDPHRDDLAPNARSVALPAPVLALAVAVVVLATASAWWAGSRGPTVYGAQAEVLVAVQDNGGGDPAADRRLSTELVVLDGGNVVATAAKQLDLSTEELRRRVDASVVDGSQVIRVSASAGSRERATEIVSVVVDAYLAQPADPAAEQSQEFLSGELEQVTARRDDLREELVTLGAAPADAPERTDVQSQLDQAVQQAAALQAQLVEVRLDQIRTGQPSVVSPPRALEDPLAPTPERSGALGALAGLLVAAALVLWALRPRPSSDPT